MVDVSERYLQTAQLERSWMVDRRIFPPWQLVQANPKYLTRPALTLTAHYGRLLCRPAHGPLQEQRRCAQSEASARQLHQLYAGEVDAFVAVWRCQHGDGREVEHTVHSWMADWQYDDDGTRTPLCIVGLLDTSSLVFLD